MPIPNGRFTEEGDDPGTVEGWSFSDNCDEMLSSPDCSTTPFPNPDGTISGKVEGGFELGVSDQSAQNFVQLVGSYDRYFRSEPFLVTEGDHRFTTKVTPGLAVLGEVGAWSGEFFVQPLNDAGEPDGEAVGLLTVPVEPGDAEPVSFAADAHAYLGRTVVVGWRLSRFSEAPPTILDDLNALATVLVLHDARNVDGLGNTTKVPGDLVTAIKNLGSAGAAYDFALTYENATAPRLSAALGYPSVSFAGGVGSVYNGLAFNASPGFSIAAGKTAFVVLRWAGGATSCAGTFSNNNIKRDQNNSNTLVPPLTIIPYGVTVLTANWSPDGIIAWAHLNGQTINVTSHGGIRSAGTYGNGWTTIGGEYAGGPTGAIATWWQGHFICDGVLDGIVDPADIADVIRAYVPDLP